MDEGQTDRQPDGRPKHIMLSMPVVGWSIATVAHTIVKQQKNYSLPAADKNGPSTYDWTLSNLDPF